jgi:methylmalonyl-CoA/ethylmalonyl-CoA epimerase
MVELLDHVGIVVRRIEEAAARYEQVLGLRMDHIEDYGHGLLRIGFIPVGEAGPLGAVKLELLEPTRPGSAAWDFLTRHGEGVEHLAFWTRDLDGALAALDRAGVPLRDRCGRVGAGGMRIAFLEPEALGGVLGELVTPLEALP